MEKNLQIVTVENVCGYVDENGTAWLNAEDVARGLGFVQTKNGVEYVKWERLNGYLKDFGFSPQVGKADYLPENMFYRLAMKANNAAAEQFQAKIADEILLAIRKHGAYLTVDAAERILDNPDFIIKLAEQVKTARAERDKALLERDNARAEVIALKPQAEYCEKVLLSDEKLTSEFIAKEYGKTAEWLHTKLRKMGVLYKRGRFHYCKVPYDKNGYRTSETQILGGGKVVTNHYWTQKGIEFIYQKLKANGFLPLRERREVMSELFKETTSQRYFTKKTILIQYLFISFL